MAPTSPIRAPAHPHHSAKEERGTKKKNVLVEGGRRPGPRRGELILRRGGKEGLSADRRVVICKKFISTFKKEREPEGLPAPGRRLEVGAGRRGGGQAPLTPSCLAWEGRGHRPQTH